uniref:Uncharacterized protein n=1 Tax=Oryza nivara TaxID=4536 RepID=A0A0E0ID44_ORYNI
MVLKPCVTVRVEVEGEEQRRFAVLLGHPKHPLLGELIDEAEHEYGFTQQGTICHHHLWPRRHGEGGCGDASLR